MDKQDKQDQQASQNEANRGQGPGRTPNAGKNNNEQRTSDISGIDRQEGEMNHGELGGNLGQEKQEPGAKDQKDS